MKMKTSELSGVALDLAVSKADNPPGRDGWGWFEKSQKGLLFDPLNECEYSPSSNWSQGGPIIEREKITLAPIGKCLQQKYSAKWEAFYYDDEDGNEMEDWKDTHKGNTPLIAAMRCYVAGKMGDVIDVPATLC